MAETAKDEAIVALLAQLSLLYWRPDFTPAQAKQLYGMYVDDLRDFPVAAIREAIRTWRRAPDSRFFPLPGQLRALMEAPGGYHFSGRVTWRDRLRIEAEAELIDFERRRVPEPPRLENRVAAA